MYYCRKVTEMSLQYHLSSKIITYFALIESHQLEYKVATLSNVIFDSF